MAPIYVASSMTRARKHPEADIMHYFRTLRDMYDAPQGQDMAHLPRMQELQERLRK